MSDILKVKVGDAWVGIPSSKGENGFSPAVSISEITGGHRVTITDENHPSGQSFDVMDGVNGNPFDYTGTDLTKTIEDGYFIGYYTGQGDYAKTSNNTLINSIQNHK